MEKNDVWLFDGKEIKKADVKLNIPLLHVENLSEIPLLKACVERDGTLWMLLKSMVTDRYSAVKIEPEKMLRFINEEIELIEIYESADEIFSAEYNGKWHCVCELDERDIWWDRIKVYGRYQKDFDLNFYVHTRLLCRSMLDENRRDVILESIKKQCDEKLK